MTLEPDWEGVTQEIVKTNLFARMTAMTLFAARLQFRVEEELHGNVRERVMATLVNAAPVTQAPTASKLRNSPKEAL